MTKSTRPERIFADPVDNAVVVECAVLKFDEVGNVISSQKKELKVHTGSIGPDVDIAKLAKRVTKKCQIIPHQWISQVEDVLVEIQERAYASSNDEESASGSACDNHEPNNASTSQIDSILESFYGDVNDQISASTKLLSLCKDVENLEHIVQHQQLMSALTRIISDQSSYSIHLTFNICKVFLALSNFEDLQPYLSQFRVGSLIMTVVNDEIKRATTSIAHPASAGRRKESQHHLVLFICLSILMRLSDDESVLRKMMKKNLVGIIGDCLGIDDLAPDTRDCAIFMLHRASTFKETRDFCSNGKNQVVLGVIDSMAKVCISTTNALGVVYNLSFDPNCRGVIIDSSITEHLPKLLRKSDTVSMSMGILYNLSSDEERRQHLYNTDIMTALMQLGKRCVDKGMVDNHLSAVLVNLSGNQLWAESMIPYSGQFLCQVEKNNDLIITQVLRNLAEWTRKIQECIGVALVSGNIAALASICTDPSKFLSIDQKESDTELSQPYAMYRKQNYWSGCMPSILTLCTESDDKSIQLEMLGVLNNLTRFDLPPSETWDTLISEYSLVDVLRNLISQPSLHDINLKVEVIILCNQMCYCGTSASSITDTHLVHDLVALWEKCDEDVEIHLQILSLCETLLSYEETRSTILFGTEAMQHIFDSLEHENEAVHLVARNCLDLLADYNGTSKSHDDIEDSFATLGKEKRFLLYHSHWVDEVMNTNK